MNPKKEDLINKWSSILNKLGDSESQLPETKSEDFQSLLPTVMKVSAKKVSLDLCFASEKEIDEVKSRVQSENRDGKIDALINNSEFNEKKLEDDLQYKELIKKGVQPLSAPIGQLFYLDFKY